MQKEDGGFLVQKMALYVQDKHLKSVMIGY